MKNGDLKIINYAPSDLIMAEYNPRQLSTEQYRQLTDSMTRFGFVDPIIVNKHPDRDNIVVGGHQRLRVAMDKAEAGEAGWDKVPCVEVKLNYDKERELNIRLNRNTGEWDYDALANYFDVENLTEWGFTDEDLQLFDAGYGEEFELPDGEKEAFQQMTFTLSDEQAEDVKAALSKAKESDFGDTGNENSNGNALWWICQSYE